MSKTGRTANVVDCHKLCKCEQMQAASVKGWRDISSVFSDKSSDTAVSPDDQLVSGITGYGSR